MINTSPTIAEVIPSFEDSLRGKSTKTLVTYRSALNRFVDYLDYRGLHPTKVKTSDLPPDILESFYIWLVKNYGPEVRSTITTYIAGARAFFSYLGRHNVGPRGTSFEVIREGLHQIMSKAGYKTPRVDKRLPLLVLYVKSVDITPLNRSNEKKRLELLRDKAVIQTLYCTGMRREEVSRLNREDIEDGRAMQAIITGKGNKERVVFFDGDTLMAIREYLEQRRDSYTPLFIRHDKARGKPKAGGSNYRLSPQSVWRIVKYFAGLAGVRATPHAFRHSKASVMLNKGAKLSEVQDILGHASPETTKKIYAHYEVSHLREAFDKYSASPEELAAQNGAAKELKP
ncbi:MAG: tyrosine-type recombinase/integrase [Chloroflexi bacterium]|nr:tyrosine-type recombinase/integrase [Chloroflexota bacterium]